VAGSYRSLSLWFDQLAPDSLRPRAPLGGDTRADVAIVGAGLTGLWTAYYLQEIDPGLHVVVVEAETAGFGASGRNGGWCSALFPTPAGRLAAESGADDARAQYAAMRATVDEVIRVSANESIDADIARGGTVVLARSPGQLERARDEVRESSEYGLGTELLDAAAARSRLNATGVVGATYTPHCAAVQPAKLARGLADVVARRGAVIAEQTRALSIAPHEVVTDHGIVRAQTVVRATEGYTPRLRQYRRAVVPVYSLIIATAPLSEAVWNQVGLRERETFSDFRHLIVYGQRTADNRMVFGGRGAPYHYGSRTAPSLDRVPRVFRALRDALAELFPVLADVPITHRWGGPLGIARDWHAAVRHDAETGLASAGGYVGDGLSTTNLAGRTLADLITGRASELTRLPWVGHRSPRWEPEPLRWLGANAALHAMTWADRVEARTGRSSRVAAVVNAMMSR
jgi:glycine/D-amino acid oxidase-like deaminating enzyme